MFVSQEAGGPLLCYLRRFPQAEATLKGSPEAPEICGTVRFYQTPLGVLVVSSVRGLPHTGGACEGRFFAMHLHGGDSCTGTPAFADAGGHYNPEGCAHPHHAGDLPPLMENRGFAYGIVLTNRFTAQEIIGRTVIIHAGVDDFTSQPAGNAGARIACGVIHSVWCGGEPPMPDCRCDRLLVEAGLLPIKPEEEQPAESTVEVCIAEPQTTEAEQILEVFSPTSQEEKTVELSIVSAPQQEKTQTLTASEPEEKQIEAAMPTPKAEAMAVAAEPNKPETILTAAKPAMTEAPVTALSDGFFPHRSGDSAHSRMMNSDSRTVAAGMPKKPEPVIERTEAKLSDTYFPRRDARQNPPLSVSDAGNSSSPIEAAAPSPEELSCEENYLKGTDIESAESSKV